MNLPDTDGPINPFRKHKVTNVILTYKEIERLNWLRERMGMKNAQLIRLGISRLYDWELRSSGRPLQLKPPLPEPWPSH